MDENAFLIEVYKESGSQVRNNATIRNTFLSFYVIALAAFVGLLAQKESEADKLLWILPVFFSVVGLLSVLILRGYTRRALNRQRLITWGLLSPHVLEAIDLRPQIDNRRIWLQIAAQSWYNRLEIFFLIVYLVPLGFSIGFSIYGDPFGLTEN